MTDIIQKTKNLVDNIRIVSYEIEQTTPIIFSKLGGKLAIINMECTDIIKEIDKMENENGEMLQG